MSKFSYGGGIEYGYAIPISRRLNIDFSFGIGYFGGEYNLYEPIFNDYLWIEKDQIKWIGPIKLEISFVWLIGRNNYNVQHW